MRAPGAAGPGVRELMAEPRVGRLRTVRLQGISTRVLFVKVRNGAEGWYSIKRKGLHTVRVCLHLLPPCPLLNPMAANLWKIVHKRDGKYCRIDMVSSHNLASMVSC